MQRCAVSHGSGHVAIRPPSGRPEGVAHEFITHPLVGGPDEDPRRWRVPLHGRLEGPRLLQPLEDLGQLRGHIKAADLVGLGCGDLSAHDRPSHFNELAAKIEITPLQAEQFSLAHPGSHRTEEKGIEQRSRVLRLVEDRPHILGC